MWLALLSFCPAVAGVACGCPLFRVVPRQLLTVCRGYKNIFCGYSLRFWARFSLCLPWARIVARGDAPRVGGA